MTYSIPYDGCGMAVPVAMGPYAPRHSGRLSFMTRQPTRLLHTCHLPKKYMIVTILYRFAPSLAAPAGRTAVRGSSKIYLTSGY